MKLLRLSLAAGAFALASSVWAQTAPTKTYIVQLADAPVATYDGHVAGLQATRTPGSRKLDNTTAPVRSYVQYLSSAAPPSSAAFRACSPCTPTPMCSTASRRN